MQRIVKSLLSNDREPEVAMPRLGRNGKLSNSLLLGFLRKAILEWEFFTYSSSERPMETSVALILAA